MTTPETNSSVIIANQQRGEQLLARPAPIKTALLSALAVAALATPALSLPLSAQAATPPSPLPTPSIGLATLTNSASSATLHIPLAHQSGTGVTYTWSVNGHVALTTKNPLTPLTINKVGDHQYQIGLSASQGPATSDPVSETILVSATPRGLVANHAVIANANFKNTTLGSADLSYDVIRASDLSGADLSGANLSHASLINDSVSQTKLPTAQNLSALYSKGLSGAPSTMPVPWRLVSGTLFGPSATLNGLSFVGIKLPNIDLTGASLLGSNFSKAYIPGAKLVQANLSAANFSSADLDGSAIINSTIIDTNFNHASLVAAGIVVTQVMDSSFQNTNLGAAFIQPPTDIPSINFTRDAFNNANLVGTHFEKSSFTQCDFTSANMTMVSAPNSSFSNNLLNAANLTWANLKSSSIDTAMFNNATLSYANLSGSTFSNTVSFGHAKADHADFSHAVVEPGLVVILFFGGATLDNASFAGDDLSHVSFQYASMENVNMESTILTDTFISSDDLRGADFSNAKFAPLKLTLTRTFSEDDLSNTNWHGTDLTGVVFDLSNLTNANLQNVKGTSVVFAYSNLSGAALAGASLENSTFQNTSLDQAGLQTTDLSASTFAGTTSLANADATYANLSKTVFYSTNLAGINLSSADLSGSTMAAVNLSNATLAGTNVAGLNISSGSGLLGITSSGLLGTPAHLPCGWSIASGVLVFTPGAGACAGGPSSLH